MLYKIQNNVKNIYMKVIIIVVSFLFIISICFCSIRLKVYKYNGQKLQINIIISKSFRIKINLTNKVLKNLSDYIYKTSSDKKIYDIKHMIETFRYHKDLVQSFIHNFNGNIVYLSINSFYYLDDLRYYLTIYYLYSYIQNQLYINLNKVTSTCFKTRLKNTSFNTEINIDLETRVYKMIYFLYKRRKELYKLKEVYNEQSSNYRIIKNINVEH